MEESKENKTIGVFPGAIDDDGKLDESFTYSRIENLLEKSVTKRDWFTPHFYRCLPLTIANSYGFVVKSEFDFAFEWNGGDAPTDITFYFTENQEELSKKYPRIESHFGSGIITVNPPFWLKTPPGVNLLTINPPNYVIPNITVMAGVVEADNLSRNFTFNLKIQIPNVRVFIPKGTPIAGFIPIPRYYADGFELKNALELFDEETIDYEYKNSKEFARIRKEAKNYRFGIDRLYYSGVNAFGVPFKDHQKPKKP